MAKEFDVVKMPEHYTSGKYECIEVMEDVFGTETVKSFCLCNQRKNGVEDLKKAVWYINKLIELTENRFTVPSGNEDEFPFT